MGLSCSCGGTIALVERVPRPPAKSQKGENSDSHGKLPKGLLDCLLAVDYTNETRIKHSYLECFPRKGQAQTSLIIASFHIVTNVSYMYINVREHLKF